MELAAPVVPSAGPAQARRVGDGFDMLRLSRRQAPEAMRVSASLDGLTLAQLSQDRAVRTDDAPSCAQ